MAVFHFKVIDRYKRVVATNQFEEKDNQAACRSVAMALAVFSFNSLATYEPATIELLNEQKARIASVSLHLNIEPGVVI